MLFPWRLGQGEMRNGTFEGGNRGPVPTSVTSSSKQIALSLLQDSSAQLDKCLCADDMLFHTIAYMDRMREHYCGATIGCRASAFIVTRLFTASSWETLQ